MEKLLPGGPNASLFFCREANRAYGSTEHNKQDEYRFNNLGTSVLLKIYPEIAVISVRGTDVASIQDWRTNLDSVLVDSIDTPGRLHCGYRDAAEEIFRSVVNKIESLNLDDSVKIICCGHSAGAAIAAIIGRKLDRCDAVYLYGSPRFSDAEYCAGYSIPVYRYSVLGDPVTCVWSVFTGWRHLGQVRLLNGGEKWEAVSGAMKWFIMGKNLFDSAFRQRKKLTAIAIGMLQKHSLSDSYIPELRRIVLGQSKTSRHHNGVGH